MPAYSLQVVSFRTPSQAHKALVATSVAPISQNVLLKWNLKTIYFLLENHETHYTFRTHSQCYVALFLAAQSK